MYKMNIEELMWLAGLLEGEGNFGLHHEQRGNWSRSRPMIQLMMTDYDVVLRAAQLLNRDKIGTRELPSGKTAYRVFLEGWPALSMMRTLQPYMFGRRRAKIQEILDYFDESNQIIEEITKEKVL